MFPLLARKWAIIGAPLSGRIEIKLKSAAKVETGQGAPHIVNIHRSQHKHVKLYG